VTTKAAGRPITGERVTTAAAGFNPTWQRHRAAYSLCERFLGSGRVLDLGCGVGHSIELLGDRESVGVDTNAQALSGQPRETHVADMRELPFADASFGSVLAVQSLEHVPDPERVLAEAARVLVPGGVAVFVTPNRLTFGRPDEIIDPYHYVEYDAASLAELCGSFFERVRVQGIFGSPAYERLVGSEHRRLDALLAKDPLRLRHLVPRRLRQLLYDRMLIRARSEPRAEAASIGIGDFDLRGAPLERALDLVAVCERPLSGRIKLRGGPSAG
jgi:SAM-dependent methyltransferase